MSDLLNRIEQTLDKCTMTGGSLELDCEELLRDCFDALQAKEESLDKANTQIERMRESENVWKANAEHFRQCFYNAQKYIINTNMFEDEKADAVTQLKQDMKWICITPPTDKGEKA